MPTLSMFYGIIIRMYKELGSQHNIPHIHVSYNDYNAVYDLEGNLIEGTLPKKQAALTIAWIAIHEDDLNANWKLLLEEGEFYKIDPLK